MEGSGGGGGVGVSLLLLLLLLTTWSLVLAEFNIDDSVLFKIDFPGLTEASLNSDESGPINSDSPDKQTVTMLTKNKEEYRCTLPLVDKNSGKGDADYTGLSPLGLMEQMFVQQSCAYRLESYWTYELCHGRFLRQYHEEREGKEIKTQEYFLGRFNRDKFTELLVAEKRDKDEGITRHPPTKKIESLNMPYYELTMEEGTFCELSGQPRRTTLLYVCYPAGKNEIYSLKETSSCEYEVIILTSVLCTHPLFRPAEAKEHSISCTPSGKNSASKPRDLVDLESESARLRSERMWEAHMRGGDKPGQVRIEIKPVPGGGGGGVEEVDLLDQDEEELRQLLKSKFKEKSWRASNREPVKPLMDPEVVKEFLRGDYCLYGGSGWWKYEFCYGKKVDQYHEEGPGQRTTINLGRFSEADHLAWLEDHPSKRPKPVAQRKHVSIFYSGGDVCDLTGKPRHIEVKLKCKPADSPSTVTLYLLEPKTCEYVLGVESPLVCDILPHADQQTGLMPPGVIDTIGKEKEEEAAPAAADITRKIEEDLEELYPSQEDSARIVELKELLRQRKEEQMQRELHHLVIQAHEAELRDKFKLSEEEIRTKIAEFRQQLLEPSSNKKQQRVVTIQTNNIDGIMTKETVENGRITRQVIVDGKVVEETVIDEVAAAEKVAEELPAAAENVVAELLAAAENVVAELPAAADEVAAELPPKDGAEDLVIDSKLRGEENEKQTDDEEIKEEKAEERQKEEL